MSGKFFIRRGDTLPVLYATLSGSTGVIDLTGATVALFFKQGGGAALERLATIVAPAANGEISYTFEAADWAATNFVFGDGNFECQVTLPSGDILTVPTRGYGAFAVTEDFGD